MENVCFIRYARFGLDTFINPKNMKLIPKIRACPICESNDGLALHFADITDILEILNSIDLFFIPRQ